MTTSKNKYHIHHKEIIAWAEGASIQILMRSTNEWFDIVYPSWDADRQYRIKPELTEAQQRLIRLIECAADVQSRIEEVKAQIEREGEEQVLSDTASELSKIEENIQSSMVSARFYPWSSKAIEESL